MSVGACGTDKSAWTAAHSGVNLGVTVDAGLPEERDEDLSERLRASSESHRVDHTEGPLAPAGDVHEQAFDGPVGWRIQPSLAARQLRAVSSYCSWVNPGGTRARPASRKS